MNADSISDVKMDLPEVIERIKEFRDHYSPDIKTETACNIAIKLLANIDTYTENARNITARLLADTCTGHWITDLQTSTEDFYICSKCGRKIRVVYPDTINNYPYCHCGAKMNITK